ncbi:MAG: tRNA uridine-5-carboxymethylaminomethyl(34) synthesis GTPase MnmE, partial [Lachnospiraceae bacterium]|nr:tRNA uridine-5-carboxymethylaminomethyl(34) synthesis GTPase MnmE [Lachnospiraceae bacterium]
MDTDTIAAIATGLSNAGIGIVRVSGKNAIGIVDRIFESKKENFRLMNAKTHTIHYGVI